MAEVKLEHISKVYDENKKISQNRKLLIISHLPYMIRSSWYWWAHQAAENLLY